MFYGQRRPFCKDPGRDFTLDQAVSIGVARYYYDSRLAIAEDAPRLRALRNAVNWPVDLSGPQWAQWYSVAIGFRPDIIIELGRGYGNSTALFTQAAARLGSTRVVSLCISSDWHESAVPNIRTVVEASWFDRLDARRADILSADYEAIIGSARRVLLLWDAHGFDIAEVVLGAVLPRLAERDHLIVMHDISDTRYSGNRRSYAAMPFWKGPDWQQRTGIWNARTNIGWMSSIQNQIIALADFATRNDLEIGSADHEFWQFFEAEPRREHDMRQLLGDEFFSRDADWAFLSLNGRQGPFFFPANVVRPVTQVCVDVPIRQIDPVEAAPPRLPIRLRTAPQPSRYAAVIYWTLPADPPPGAPVWLRLRIHVQDGLVGVGLLNKSGSVFLEKRLAAPTDGPEPLYLPLGSLADIGGVVVYTWAQPESARVEISELSLVW